jgi:hypothetical protein
MNMQTQPNAESADQAAHADLHGLLSVAKPDPKRIRALLDGMAEADRIAAARSLTGREQRHLWKAVDGAHPLQLADLVPASVPAMTAVRHYGRNSLPVFSMFEKRFYRSAEQDPNAPNELCGANFQLVSPLTGPGYFVVHAHATRSELDVDYRSVPSQAPTGWPAIAPNDRGRSRLVFGFMVDTLRRVSEHVTIGSAARHGKDMGSYFVLCREQSAG